MTSWQTVCDVLAALPETELDQDSDHPAWRVNGKVLARCNPRLRVADEGEIRRERGELIAVRTDHGEREALIQMDPRTFFFTPHWETSASVLVWLETVDGELLRKLLIDAWRSRAPKRLVREWEGGVA